MTWPIKSPCHRSSSTLRTKDEYPRWDRPGPGPKRLEKFRTQLVNTSRYGHLAGSSSSRLRPSRSGLLTMSLPTPPGTSHRAEKENKRPGFPRVAWAEEPEYHTLVDISQCLKVFTSSTATPTRSILKKSNYAELPSLEPDVRETTPEPSDPLVNLHYLDNPVSRLLASDAAMRDIIESYNILMARLRLCVVDDSNTDASWPLFQPLRKNRDALVQAMCRDLGRALEEPTAAEDEEESRVLPSPEKSPKKRGMTAEQAKRARDLCTTAHSAMKFLSMVFTLPYLFNIFEESHLADLLTGVLAIPLTPKLPTPNARKTCALAISLLQMQRLPEVILLPARDRIAYALRRGIEGELGKEGKKGSCNDGLRAIHDLSIHYPATFVPAFAEILPAVFSQLLAPTVALRLQACHALGGFSFGLASLPVESTHSRVASMVALWLTKAPLGTPSKKPSSPSKDPLIIRTLRTTLGATDPKHAAQGPVWGLSVLSSLIVMLGSQVHVDERMTKILTPLLSFAMRHQKSSVRALVCLIWRVMTWAYFQPVCPKLSEVDEDLDEPQEQYVLDYTDAERKHHMVRLEESWTVVSTVVDMGAGVSTLCALLGTPATTVSHTEWAIKKSLAIIEDMIAKGGQTCKEAVDALATLVCPTHGQQSTSVFDVPEALDDDTEWNPMKLLPLGLFSANPGLLTTEYSALSTAVRPLFGDCPHVEDLRALTKDELTIDWVFDTIINIWKDGWGSMSCSWNEPLPIEMLDIWSGLWAAAVSIVKDDVDSEQLLSSLAHRAVNLIIIILRSDKFDLSGHTSDDIDFPHTAGPGRGLPKRRWKPALKLRLARELWRRLRDVFGHCDALTTQAERLLVVLERKETELVVKPELPDEVRGEWALMCAEVVGCCEDKEMSAFWGMSHKPKWRASSWTESVRRVVWTQWVQKWGEEEASWESSVLLLAAPFLDVNAWDMSNENLDTWDRFLKQTIDRALDNGHDSVGVVDAIARMVAPQGSLSLLSSTRISDLLLSHLDISEAPIVPASLCELVNDTLDTSYPPMEQNKLPSIWLLRTLTRTLDACPVELVEHLLECVQDGLCRWISDESQALSDEEYSSDVVPVYQTAAVVLMSVPAKADVVERFAGLLHSAFVGRDKPETMVQAFVDLWETTYKSVPSPEDGWSEKILACLHTSGLAVPDEPADVESSDAEEVEDHLLGLPPSSDDVPLSPEVPSPKTLAAPFVLFSPVRKFRGLPYPTTPTTAKSRLVTPSRPHKSSSPVQPMGPLLIFESPSRSPTRSPISPKKRTPGPGIRGSDKENASPLHLIASVAERITQRSPLPTGGPVLGKRSFDLDDDEEYLAEGSKRAKRDVPMAALNQPAKFDARAPVLPPYLATSKISPSRPSPSKKVLDFKTPSNPKKRKGMVLDAVEVPTMREVMRTTVSFDVPATSERPTKQKDLRRTQSAVKLSEQAIRSPSPAKKRKTAPLPEKSRRRNNDDSHDGWTPSSSLNSTLSRLRDMEAIGSDDSIMLEQSVGSDSDIPSSDDDPNRFLGVVTPHRLMSPAIRRLKDFDDFTEEPGSDDSNVPRRADVGREDEAMHDVVASKYDSQSVGPTGLVQSIKTCICV
ncbi:uncharacterized protein PHACADRAFT_187259 [Phanerochaete carnosa HHB-10118-sp]|uniref:Telomere-associated protein Rif1 N-terminal domain-containing protein n=1 Tax=Phanerochaete carnosa (strain HHB-10118-sp) TaxID=650164 RepID=K5WNJ3_PHACS|nr:uncharacterized protein PHACADRAFT_187259 [Phanerochaete carnosa HHB-10118-sp]EKM51867.1 hypothetical protein PHACADRAFT_187259 [Phanerochaete carnosa HHB-10118-sp]